MNDTIFALSSGNLPSGVAVVRISGPQAFPVCQALTGDLPLPRKTTLRILRDRFDQVIDQGLVLVFTGPASFTGEDCIEFQIHGGKAVVAALLEELAQFPGLRHAEAGEFSRRAFENGRLDLVEVEGLGDLINAETEMQRRLALEQMAGHVSLIYNAWADQLKHARAMIEAELDFPDEEDVPGSVSARVWVDLQQLSEEMQKHLERSRGGEIIRDGLKVVIAGPPNAGKSTLFNQLVQRDAAIVTDIPGTTRDILQADIVIDGFAVKLYDTAGLRQTEDVVEQIGVNRAKSISQQADVVLLLESQDCLSDVEVLSDSAKLVRIRTKADLYPSSSGSYDVIISSQTGFGLDALKRLIVEDAKELASSGLALASRQRQIVAIRETKEHIDAAIRALYEPLDLRAELLRRAANCLGRITGRIDVEQLLDVIFSQFCIGK